MGELLQSLDTPAVVVDLDVMDRNLKRMADMASKAGVRLRPHAKTHKSKAIAARQLSFGAAGLTVAKLGEAEVMLEAGVQDILVAFPIVGSRKLERLAAMLQAGAEISIGLDNETSAGELSALGQALGQDVRVLIDVNSGLNRCGREPGEATAALAAQIAGMPGLRVAGLMTHAGHAYGYRDPAKLREIARHEAQSLLLSKRLLEERGVGVDTVSVGSTPTSKYISELAGIGITEVRPGAYVFGDGIQLGMGIIGEEECAMHVLATVVSMPRPGTAIIDAGSKTFSSDGNPHQSGFGSASGYPGLYIERLTEEHGIVHVPEGSPLQVGDRLLFLPNHCCAVTNLHDRLYGVRGGQLAEVLQVDARGKIM